MLVTGQNGTLSPVMLALWLTANLSGLVVINYGFRSDIPADSVRWNFYADWDGS